jgi:hypothetical protein
VFQEVSVKGQVSVKVVVQVSVKVVVWGVEKAGALPKPRNLGNAGVYTKLGACWGY